MAHLPGEPDLRVRGRLLPTGLRGNRARSDARGGLAERQLVDELSGQVARIAGPAVGAALIAAGGTPLAFGLNALSFFVSAACLVPLRGTALARSAAAGAHSVRGDLRQGLATVLASPWLWVTISIAALGNIMWAGPFGVALPFLVKDQLHGDVGTLGVLYAVFPAGFILGSLWLGAKTKIRHRGVTAYLGLLATSLMIFVFGLPVPLLVLGLAALINGAGLQVFSLIWTNTVQELVPRDQLGRVASIDLLGSYALLPVGYALAGWATQAIGPALVFIVGGLGGVVLTLLALDHPAIRALD